MQGDIACGLTHLSIFDMISKGADDYAVVMEDDLYLSDDAAEFLCSEAWIPKDADIVKLETCNQITALGIKRTKITQKHFVSRLLDRHWGTAIYIIKKSAAIQILENFTAGMNCIDLYMFGDKVNFYKVYQVHPAVGIQGSVYNPGNELLVSDIRPYRPSESSKGESQIVKVKGLRKMKRELLRAKTKIIDGVIFSWFYVVKRKIRTRIKFK